MIDLNMHKEVLLSVINTRLRNDYPSIEACCDACDIDLEALTAVLAQIDYVYDRQANQFKHRDTQ